MKHTITEIVKGNLARFSHYRSGVMYYTIILEEGSKYTFPVYLNDISDVTLYAEVKAIMLIKYVRSAIRDGTLVYE